MLWEAIMNLETTTCISYEHLQLLKHHADKNKLSLHSCIVALINYTVLHKTIAVKAYTRLSYRKRYIQWKRLHIMLLEHEYEFILDLKKVYKMSFAKLIAYCIDNYLYEFLEALEKEDNTDNYRCGGYTFRFFLEEGIQCCQFYWGPPPEILTNLNIT